jgi:ferredoxin
MPVVTFERLQKQKKVTAGATLIAAANRAGVPIGQSCGGEGACGWCRVRIITGAENLSKTSQREAQLIHEKRFAGDERVACQVKVFGDVRVGTEYW